jgi:hypothetical protein
MPQGEEHLPLGRTAIVIHIGMAREAGALLRRLPATLVSGLLGGMANGRGATRFWRNQQFLRLALRLVVLLALACAIAASIV